MCWESYCINSPWWPNMKCSRLYNIHFYDHAKLQMIYRKHFISSSASSHCIMFRFASSSSVCAKCAIDMQGRSYEGAKGVSWRPNCLGKTILHIGIFGENRIKTHICYLKPVLFRNKGPFIVVRKCKEWAVRIRKKL